MTLPPEVLLQANLILDGIARRRLEETIEAVMDARILGLSYDFGPEILQPKAVAREADRRLGALSSKDWLLRSRTATEREYERRKLAEGCT